MRYVHVAVVLIISLIMLAGCSTQKQSQVQYATKDRLGLELSLMLVRPDYSDGRFYVATATFRNLRAEQVGNAKGDSVEILEIVAVDKDNKVVKVEQPDKFAFDDSKTQAFGTPPGVNYTKTVRLTFKKPGTYRIYCGLKDALLHKVRPGGRVLAVPIKLKTDPIEIMVR